MTPGFITEEWLKSAGFTDGSVSSSRDKRWQLRMGQTDSADVDPGFINLGIELTVLTLTSWACLFVSHNSIRPRASLHMRSISTRRELIDLVEAVTGEPWCPNNHINGAVLKPFYADLWRKSHLGAPRTFDMASAGATNIDGDGREISR